MSTHKKNRHVGIVGIGQTEYSSHKEHQNQAEMVNEAVRNALSVAGITLDDIDCVSHGNMELFEMVHQPDMWHSLGTGAFGKDQFRITTGGTTGASLVCAADSLVASGLCTTSSWPSALKNSKKATRQAASPIWRIPSGSVISRQGR